MTERERRGLRGPVHRCDLQRTLYSQRCGADACEREEWNHFTTLEFRADGALAACSHQNPDGSRWTSIYDYDDAGRLTAVRNENEGRLVCLQLYQYDAMGRLVQVVMRTQDGDRVTEKYEYDTAGRKTKTQYAEPMAQRPDVHRLWSVEGADGFYSAPGAAAVTTLYNERGQALESLFHDKAGVQLSRVDFRYDAGGRLIEEAQINAEVALPAELLAQLNPAQRQTVCSLFGAGEEAVRRTHRYDGQGRRIETRSQISALLGGACRRVTYNELGDEIYEIDEHVEREYGINGEGQLSDRPSIENTGQSEARLRYEYDARGNWVMKAVESRGGTDQEFRVSSMERRVITYFE